ncbi:MAG TPA: helix-turn-helix transcriptional regulator [Spirochaetota bacterium]|nr:helix-turn-helix transcriptional regulator [Spirochaetota bacterium]
MKDYNIFDNDIDDSIREKHDALMAETKALFDASNLIAEAMDSNDYSQKELAAHLKKTPGYVSRVLSGTENISLRNLAHILHSLNLELVLSSRTLISHDNVVWVDFSKADNTISAHIENKSSSEWIDPTITSIAR